MIILGLNTKPPDSRVALYTFGMPHDADDGIIIAKFFVNQATFIFSTIMPIVRYGIERLYNAIIDGELYCGQY